MKEDEKQKPAPKRAVVQGVELDLGAMDWELGDVDATDDRPESRLADASEVSK